jgi:hypothetical protein
MASKAFDHGSTYVQDGMGKLLPFYVTSVLFVAYIIIPIEFCASDHLISLLA